MDTLTLSRIQFALTTLFHILFPALTIGLSLYLVIVEGLWLRTMQEVYYRMYRFWAKIFAVNFAVGAVSGIVLEFEFGTNFSRFSQAVGNVFSPLLAFEVLTAFFLEGGFLGIMLFGWNRVSRGLHFLATTLVCLGGILSAFWILAANSWLQTPAGHRISDGKFFVTDFYSVVLNPSSLVRMSHMTLASFSASVFVIAGMSAFFLLKGREDLLFRKSLGLSLLMAAIFVPLQIWVGDISGRILYHHQPEKLAAIEALWETNEGKGAPFALIAFPDMEEERNRFEMTIPDGLSLLVTHSSEGRVLGLKAFPRANRPNSAILFWTFRAMVAIGFFLLLIMIWALFLWRRGKLFIHRVFLRTLLLIHPLGFIAIELGWITTEVGRQPWLVYRSMRTAEGVSPIAGGNVIWSLALFLIILPVVGASYFYYVKRIMDRGPDLASPIPPVQRRSGMISLRVGDNVK
jgi:cytochrome bd ubiquinol oxidase subunit I